MGDLTLDLANVGRSRGALRLVGLTIPQVGTINAELSLTRRDRDLVTHLAAALTPPGAPEAATITLEAVTPPVRRWTDPDAWVRGLSTVAARVEIADLANLPPLDAALPETLRLRGRFLLTANVSRPNPGDPLTATVGVEARRLVVDLARRSALDNRPTVVPAVQPMWVRGVACATLTSLRPDDVSPRVRLAVGRDFDAPSSGPPPACDDEALMPRSLLAADATLRGPWQTAAGVLGEVLALRDAAIPARSRAALAAARVDARFSVGPVLRSEWPLRTIALAQPDGSLSFLRPPDVAPGTMVHAELRAAGSFLAPRVEVEAEATAPSLAIAGLAEPLRADVFAVVSPREGGTLLDSWAVNLNLRALSQPSAPRDQQGRVEADIRLSTRVADLRTRGAGGLSWDRFDVDSENLRIERLAWARERGLEGRVAVRLLATADAAQPVTATVTVEDFRARLAESLRGATTPTARARVHANVRNEGGRLVLRSCAIATTAAGVPECAPGGAPPAPPTETVLVDVTVPFAGELPRVAPDLGGVVFDLVAAGYPLETLSRFVPDELASNLGGRLEAQIHWDGAHPRSPSGRVALRDGQATLTALGEPMRNLDLLVLAQDSRVRIDHVDALLGRGTLHLDGAADVRDDGVALRMTGRLQRVPAVLSGYTWAWLDGAVAFTMDFGADAARGRIEVERLSALVQDQPSNNLQPLDEDPDVFIIGRTQLAQPDDVSDYAIELAVHSQTPVWLRRSDFAIAVRTDLRIRKDRAGLALAGSITQASNQSWYSIFGKQFDLERVRVTFDGNLALNPELDIAARHDSPSAGRISVAVTGRLEHPTILLTSESFPTASQAEILAMIALGRRSPAASSTGTDFAGQFAQAIVSLVSGIVASGISREFAFLPTIIAEPATDGGGGRYGAGVNLSPRLYLQATYSASGGSGSQAASTGSLSAEVRLLLEYAVNEAVTFAASGSSRGAGSADVFWSP